jgi:hypothetical protein
LNQRARPEPFFSEPLPDAPWPVEARNLLTDRELSLYQSLLSLYPEHKIFVQVALSQLIEVDRNHPESESIRARYKQLVADFVLCRADLSVVAVIELDDRSHENPRNQYADARKSKVLKDARIRLVRIPAGALPSEDRISALIDAGGAAGKTSRHQPFVFQRAMQPLVVRHVIAPAPQPSSAAAVIPAGASPLPVVGGPSAQTLAEENRAGSQAAAVLQKQRDQAWAAFYSPPTSCEHPVDWNAQVECGNQFMRAKKRFEVQWVADHASDQTSGAVVP